MGPRCCSLPAPLALGSFWGLLLIPAIVGGMVARPLDEEKHLRADPKGIRCLLRTSTIQASAAGLLKVMQFECE
jgi:hypothetical protein